ncbi:MAG: hypothetical protein ACRDRJ_28520 [Streptosporangiaceae bacterium]
MDKADDVDTARVTARLAHHPGVDPDHLDLVALRSPQKPRKSGPSDRGRVWSIPRRLWVKPRGRRRYWRVCDGTPLRAAPDKDGYMKVGLVRDRKARTLPVHQLVMLAFVGTPPENQEVLHGRAGRLVNHWPENLSYGTRAENAADRLRDGTDTFGERNGMAKLAEADVIEIRRLYESTLDLGRYHPERWTLQRLADEYGVDRCTIHDALQGKTWKHLAA